MGFNLIAFGWGIPLICGCDSYNRRIKKPPREWQDMLEATPTYYCPRCAQMQPGAVFRTSNFFTFFCIPLCPLQRDEPYIGCLLCKRPVESRSAKQVCGRCGTWRGDARFCPSCGQAQLDGK